MKRNLDDILSYDPLHEAERATGHDYHDSEATTALGMLLALHHNATKQEALLASGDTTMSDTLERYMSIVESFGFAEVLRVPFAGEDGKDDSLVFMAESTRGLLLVFDTWMGTKVNGGSVYYNWRPRSQRDGRECVSSGGWRDGVLVGYHDCREAIIHKLRQMDERGEFVVPWIDQPFLRMSHYGESGTRDHEVVREERIAMLPREIRAMMGL